MPLPRPCNKCGKRFQPYGKTNKMCDECRIKAMQHRKKNEKNMHNL